jgi:hypothetical protein
MLRTALGAAAGLMLLAAASPAAAQIPLLGPVKDRNPPLAGTDHIWHFRADAFAIDAFVIQTGSFLPDTSVNFVAPPRIMDVRITVGAPSLSGGLPSTWATRYPRALSTPGPFGSTRWQDTVMPISIGNHVRVAVKFSREFTTQHWVQFIPLSALTSPTPVGAINELPRPEDDAPDVQFLTLPLELLGRELRFTRESLRRLQLVGFTTATINGLSGYFGGTRLCQAEFSGGSRMCTSSEVMFTIDLPTLPAPTAGQREIAWLHPAPERLGGSDSDYSGAKAVACNGWSRRYAGALYDELRQGLVVDTDGRFLEADCQELHRVACCGLPKTQ